jgi:glutathione synthase/RimK-type ligase-like ATP-grasp enzyme
VTCARLADLVPDDRLLIEPLRTAGIEAIPLRWDATDVDWAELDGAVIRSTWDYQARPVRFQRWIESCDSAGVRLWNPPHVLLWNMHKRYLRELEKRGVPIVPTVWLNRGAEADLGGLMDERGWRRVVVKPAVSAGARRTSVVGRAEVGRAEPEFRSLLARRDLLVQPFLDAISGEGEWSFVFFGRVYSHAVLKRPASGDFRVQERFGGSAAPAEPPARLVEQASRVLAEIEGDLLYARVDGVREGDRFLLFELEVLEPSLFLDLVTARRLAGEIARRVAR